ncbi:MAG: BspA family leucine-rich repeat surface protein [Christensenellales bacterium]
MKKKLTLLIFTACAVFVGSVGLIFWALAATQVNITSGLLVTYTPTPQVVCNTSATYQRTNDASAVAFKNGNLSFGYGGTMTDETMEATTNALQLDDSNTYVVFEFTFTNQNNMENYDLTITLTDNGTVTNMTRKYYFGDLSSSNISAKRTTIKNSGIDNSALSSKKLVLGYQETGRIYMLLEITPGTVASYLADNTNKFVFNMTTAEHVEVVETVAYLKKTWVQYLGYSMEEIESIRSISFTKDESLIAGLANSASVGTNAETGISDYVESDTISDVTAYWGSDKSAIVIYSSGTIYAPKYSTGIFASDSDSFGLSNLTNLDLSNFDTSKVTDMSGMFNGCSSLTSLDVSNFDTSKVTTMARMFYGCSSLTSLNLGNFNLASCTNFGGMFFDIPSSKFCSLETIVLPYNLQSGLSIMLPASDLSVTTWSKDGVGSYEYIGTATSGSTVACSTENEKVTLQFIELWH